MNDVKYNMKSDVNYNVIRRVIKYDVMSDVIIMCNVISVSTCGVKCNVT